MLLALGSLLKQSILMAWFRTSALFTVQAHFDAAVSAAGGSIRSARVAKRKGPDGKPLSAGFGFVECSSEEVAKIGVSKMQVQLHPSPAF